MMCQVCGGRGARGFYYRKPRTLEPSPKIRCCSMKCLDIAYNRQGKMIDPTKKEIAAIEAASVLAGQYIDSIGKTDMATWSEFDWMNFIEAVVTGYSDEMQRLTADEVPF